MSDLLLFIIGCVVCFLFGGGALIHIVANQKITPVDEPKPGPEHGARDQSESTDESNRPPN